MGQKINSTIFRLELKNNLWKTKYFGKNIEESAFYNYQNLEIRKYFKIFLNRTGLILHNYKLEYNLNNIKIFISYCSKLKLEFFFKNNTLKKIKFKKLKKKLLNKYYKFYLYKNLKNKNLLKKNNFLQQFLEILSFFAFEVSIVLVKFQNLNKNLFFKLSIIEQTDLKKKLFLLRKFVKKTFFKEVLNIVFLVMRFKNSATLLADVISSILKKMKKHNFFLIFLKYILFLFLNAKFSKINGIKINIKGKLNNLSRAKNKIIAIGLFSTQSIISNVNYCEKTIILINGSLTVKVWIHQK